MTTDKKIMKATPGPWKLMEGTYENGHAFKVVGPKGSTMFVMVAGDLEARLANARLIEAASELLEALKGIVDNEHACTCGEECDGKCWHSIARATIAKVEGSTP